jgi:TonB family protein
MKNNMPPTRSYFIMPVIGSFLVHLAVLVFFALTALKSPPKVQELFEVALAQTPTKGSPANQGASDELLTGRERSATQMNLPKQRLLNNDQEQIAIPSHDSRTKAMDLSANTGLVGNKISPTGSDKTDADRHLLDSSLVSGKRGIKEFTGPEAHPGKDFVYGSPHGTANNAYNLEWVTGGQRQVIEQYLPQYPPGLEKETSLKLKFMVLPDGTVDQVLPVKKGDPVLEEVTIKAFKKWKFEPLSPSAEQKTQEGRITFVFKLK